MYACNWATFGDTRCYESRCLCRLSGNTTRCSFRIEVAHRMCKHAGYGRYTDAGGNTFTGTFKQGAFEGSGTYLHADGRAEVGHYVAGKDTGVGARWNPERTQASPPPYKSSIPPLNHREMRYLRSPLKPPP
eukprot:1177001-Prorocentrum_minimum.AAC.4